jgi:HlyD family secretion protein
MKLFTPGKITALVVVALVGGGYRMLQMNGAETAKPAYRTQVLDRGTIAQRVSANGTLNPVTVVNVGTQISGTVTRLHADFNAVVKQGQILAELDPALLQAQIAQSEANRRSMQATWTLARSTLERNQSLRDRGFISDSALDSARKDLDSAAAQIAAIKAQLDRDRTNLSYSVIRSPINGIVVDRTVDVGQTVAASFQTPTLFKIARDLKAMQIDTSVSEADIGNIKPGMPVAFTVDAFREREFAGVVRVVRLNPTVQQNVVTYNVVIDVSNDTGTLLPGMTAQVSIVTQRRDNVVRLPNAALRFRPAGEVEAKVTAAGTATPRGNRVYTLAGSGDLLPVEVRTGIADTRFTELLGDNVKEGDAVVVREISGDKGANGTGGSNFRMRFF